MKRKIQKITPRRDDIKGNLAERSCYEFDSGCLEINVKNDGERFGNSPSGDIGMNVIYGSC
jgi:hypothetical protein